MRILGISGSLRAGSHNTRLLEAAGRLLPESAELHLLDPALLREIPAYDEDLRDAGPEPPAVRRLREEIARSDAVLFATPEYNSSIPGFLKNALDWISRPLADSPLKGKDVAVVGASTGMFGAVWAQAELRKVLGALGARVVDRELPLTLDDDAWQTDGGLESPDLREALAEHVGALLGALSVQQQEPLRRAA